MKITPITQNYNNPYFGSVTYKKDGPVSACAITNAQKTIEWFGNSSQHSNNALVKLLALGLATEDKRGTAEDYPVDVFVAKDNITIRMPKVEPVKDDSDFEYEDVSLVDLDDLCRELEEDPEDDAYDVERELVPYKSEWSLKYDPRAGEYYKVVCNKHVGNNNNQYRNAIDDAFNDALEEPENMLCKNENNFICEYLSENYGF